MPEFSDLSNLENWVHLNPYILDVYFPYYFSWVEVLIGWILNYLNNKRNSWWQN